MIYTILVILLYKSEIKVTNVHNEYFHAWYIDTQIKNLFL